METDLNLLIAAGVAAAGCIAIGLIIGLVRGHFVSDRLRGQLTAVNDQLKTELAEARSHIRGLSVELEQNRAQLRDALLQIGGATERLSEITSKYHALQNDHIRLETEHRERQDRHTEQVLLLNEARDNLKREFENLANRIFEDKGKSFTTTSRESLEALLKPFREQITGFQSRINEVHSESLRGNTILEKEIQKVLEVGLEMNSQATNLTSALKGDKKTAGNWGEAQLQRTLELAGLQAGEHYEAQAAFRDEEGKRKLPDFVIRLPDGKNLVIDSKVSLVDYDRAISADTDEERTLALNAHAQAVRNHIDDLASKDYANLPGIGSPDFVLMFMPVEPAYIEAMKHNKDLFNYGYKKGVIMVSHTTLMPILRTVANLWMIEQSNTRGAGDQQQGRGYLQPGLPGGGAPEQAGQYAKSGQQPLQRHGERTGGPAGSVRQDRALPATVDQGQQGNDGAGTDSRRH